MPPRVARIVGWSTPAHAGRIGGVRICGTSSASGLQDRADVGALYGRLTALERKLGVG
jgi:hypothetical protein